MRRYKTSSAEIKQGQQSESIVCYSSPTQSISPDLLGSFHKIMIPKPQMAIRKARVFFSKLKLPPSPAFDDITLTNSFINPTYEYYQDERRKKIKNKHSIRTEQSPPKIKSQTENSKVYYNYLDIMDVQKRYGGAMQQFSHAKKISTQSPYYMLGNQKSKTKQDITEQILQDCSLSSFQLAMDEYQDEVKFKPLKNKTFLPLLKLKNNSPSLPSKQLKSFNDKYSKYFSTDRL